MIKAFIPLPHKHRHTRMTSSYSYSIHHHVFVLALFTVMLCIQLSVCSSNGDLKKVGCIERERQALLTLKHSLSDPSNRLSSWVVGTDCCQWDGIGCSNVTGHVIKLDLRNSNKDYWTSYCCPWNRNMTYDGEDCDRTCLAGREVNPSLTELKHLQYLDLSCNDFSYTKIPKFFGDFKALRYLNLSDAFRGVVPHSLGNLSTLRQLDLSYNNYPYLRIDNFNWLSHLSALHFLSTRNIDLSQTSNSDLSQVLRSFPFLSHLDLSWCELSKFPNALRNFTSVEFSNANQNLTSLETLDLSYNSFGRGVVPDLWSQLKNLKYLDLSDNHFTGLIPTSLSTFSALTELDLSSNFELNGSIPDCLGALPTLTKINLRYNQLSGSIPKSLGTLPTLTHVDLSFNQLSGSIPAFFGTLSLEVLDLSYNQLSGSLPESLGQFVNLTHLDVSFNSFTGVVSEVHFENLFSLKELFLSTNPLQFNVSSDWIPSFQLDAISLDSYLLGPRFPLWLKTQKTIRDISLKNASISDSIPSWFWCLPLTELSLSNNKIQGLLPIFQHNSNITYLDLSNNSISGPIPLNFKNMMPNLRIWFLSNNNITGVIPASFCEMSNLETLDLSNNHLHGDLPQNCWNDSNFDVLDLTNNKLSGVIPRSFGNFPHLFSLHLSNNRFNGELPLALKDLLSLEHLDLSKNGLSGNIPSWIGRISMLSTLNLRSNQFDGIIIPELCNLTHLRIVDISHNNFSGVIPRCFKNLNGMISRRGDISSVDGYDEKIMEIVKGRELEYSKTLEFLVSMDLSCNELGGRIPEELMSLSGLNALNLSNNHLRGSISENIGVLKSLESLDLSKNELSGMIPQSILELKSLSHLDLSYNDLLGRIPSGFQLDTFQSPSYMGNSKLCGEPLENKCEQDGDIDDGGDKEEEKENFGFYIGMGIGTAVGLWGVFATLLLKKTLRYSYFRCVENVYDVLVVKTIAGASQLRKIVEK